MPLALDNVCPHRGGPLAEGTVEHGKIVCPWHQWEFDLATGQATHSSATKATSYPLHLQGDDVLVEL
jgi:nitrite reductase (NADH) small subunit